MNIIEKKCTSGYHNLLVRLSAKLTDMVGASGIITAICLLIGINPWYRIPSTLVATFPELMN